MGPLHPNRYPPQPVGRPPRTEGKAVASLLLGLLSIGCIGPFAGIPAMIVGSLARRDIDRAGGELTGRGLAVGGIVSGLFGTGLGSVVLLWALGAMFTPEPAPEALATPTPTPTVALPASASPDPDPDLAPAPPATSGPIPRALEVRAYGSLQVVDLDASRPLRAQLGEIVRQARTGDAARPRTVVLQTFITSSAACAAVDAALPDARMQGALANVTLVRVDLDEYANELRLMRVETRSAPWFYKLDAKGAATDALSADAWDANLPENMAPVLGRFVQHTPPRRHHRR